MHRQIHKHIRIYRAAFALIIAIAASAPTRAAAAPSGALGHAAEALRAGPRDLQLLAKADAAGSSAAVVRQDSGGGAPRCHLITFEGKSAAPVRTTGRVQLPVCPAYDKGQPTAKLDRVPLGSRRQVWRVHLGSKRMDTIAQGVETRDLWALVGEAIDGGLPLLFQRTSTTFHSKKDPAANSSETCAAPVLDAADEERLTIACETMAMLGAAVKKARAVFAYRWQGEAFQLEQAP